MSVREDRLWAEYDAMKKFRSQVVTWETVGNNRPPDVYLFTYHLKSIVGFSGGKPKYHTGFKVQVSFPPDYPRGKPDVWLASEPYPFHPNIWRSGHFCLEGTQHWIPGIGVPLDWICQMVGEMIAFQEVYLGSPANGDSTLKNWVKRSLSFRSPSKVSNPVDPAPIRLPDLEDAISWGSEPSPPRRERIRFG
jgi:ubiquitin-protein ligase